uniref:chitobiase/beta-hexosaminidase C-terminal domain-containing protein n=1 Tax=uncultured Draconibacterium sp. TaxID=1573823 RepID=UPI003216CBB9
MKTSLYLAVLLFFIPVCLWAQEVSSLEEEKSAPFSYYKTSVDQLGFKDCPEATAVTNGGIFSNNFIAIEFQFGSALNPATKRVIDLEKNYLPVIQYKLNEGNITYELEAFSAPEDLKPENNLITYVRWTISNKGKKKEQAKMGFKLIPLYSSGWKNFLRHNRYCTPWYRDQFMDEETYKKNQELFFQNDAGILQGNHLVMNCPEGFNKDESSDKISPRWTKDLQLDAGESKELVFKIPVVPVNNIDQQAIAKIKQSDAKTLKTELVSFWEKELKNVEKFHLPEQKIMNMFRTSYINLLNSKDLLADKKNTIQRCNEFQYDHFYVRDNAYFARVYDMLGEHEIAHNILQPYFIYDIEGKTIHFRQRTGIYKKLCHDYWGQVVWALGAHYRQTRNRKLLEKVYELLPNHVKEFELAVAKDPRGLWPASWPYDNEHIDGHYTGHSFWAILGLRYAVFLAEEMGNKEDASNWQKILDQYVDNFNKELKQITDQTGGYIPPGIDNPEDGFDWANASAGLYPFEAIDKNDPVVRKTLEMVRNYNYMEGISTYSGCNALVAKSLVLNNHELPERGLHHYETFYVTTGNLVIGEQQKVIEDLYSILVHTSSTHGGFEWKPTPWGNRDPGRNRQPHGWMAARYIELIRNMLVREEGNDIHLLSAVSPEWIREGESIKVDKAPTYFGEVSYELQSGKNYFTVDLDGKWNDELGKIYFHIPWFIKPKSITVDGKNVAFTSTAIELQKNTKNIKVSWKNRIPVNLSFNKAVDIFLDKYHNRPEDANYVHLFPALAAPGSKIDKTQNILTLFSPDNYADIYFTIDGSEPGINSIKYKKPVSLNNVAVVKAICIDKNGEKSDCKTIHIK